MTRALVYLNLCTLVALFFVCCLPGCGRKEAPTQPSEPTNTVAISFKPSTEPLRDGNKHLEEMIKSMPESERKELERLSGQELQSLTESTPSEPTEEPETKIKFEVTQEMRDLVVAATRAFLADLPDQDKIAALQKLLGIDDPIVLDVVMMALNDDNPDIRELALDVIMNIDDPAVIPAVIKALDDDNPDIREYALDALMEVDDPRINEALIKALDDENVDVRDNALNVMLYISSPNVIDALAKAITDPDPDIREKAIIIIEDIEDPRVIDILIEKGLLHDDDNIRQDALDSLNFITDQEFQSYEEARAWWDRNRASFSFDR
ncbi:MAG: HEAT repeat domain-containing protein [bacterium]|nr:HEAT repeat domain-containing protein [bacterium]